MYPGSPFDEIWETQKEQLKVKKIRLRWKTAIQKVRKPKIPERFVSVKELWKYYLNHTSYHGLNYWQDKKLHPFERIFWVLVFLIGFSWSITIIFQIYSEFQSRKSNIVIDEVNKEIAEVPFPSITVCPPTRVDWVKVLEVADKLLILKGNEKAKQHFLEMVDRTSHIRLWNLNEFWVDVNDSTVLQILNEINMGDVMLNVLPDCESLIFNCTWQYANQTCCDIFELQKSAFGYCYSFNSLMSEKSSADKIPQSVFSYGMHSGLRFSTLRVNKSHLPPSMKELSQPHPLPVMISDVGAMPLKTRYFTYGNRYYVSLKFKCSYASAEILALENEQHPPCKHENGLYKYENCLINCTLKYIEEKCECLPLSFFKLPANREIQSCNISKMQCVSAAVTDFQVSKGRCHCYNECEYIDYDDFTGTIPNYNEDRILIDVHFDGPSGVCYKREIVVNSLDMLVKFGGIFSLFVGGSLISFAELLYSIFLTIIFTVCCKFNYFKKKERNESRLVIEVHSRNDSALQSSRENDNDM